jgi:hypothetical protein
MAKDKPSFLQNIGDDEEEKDVLSVLQDEPEKTEETKTDVVTEEKKEPEQPTEQQTQTETEPQEKTTETKTDTQTQTGTEEKSTEKKEEKNTEEKPLIMGKYKNVEELEKAYLELQRAFNRLQNEAKRVGVNPNTNDELAVFRKTPLIRSNIPDPSYYYFTNERGEEVLDLNAWMRDTLNNYSIAIQQNLLGGPLASAVYTLLSKAISEEHNNTLEEARRQEEAVRIWNNVQKTYPILSKDQRLQLLFERAIYGEKRRREIEAQQNGTEPVQMTEEDYIKLAGEIVGSQPSSPQPQPEEPIEKVKSDVPLKGTTSSSSVIDEIERDIEEMMNIKRKSIF